MDANKKVAERIAARCEDAYSFGRYAPGEWVKAAAMLLGRGYTERQAEAVLRSKWARWAGDMAESEYGQHTARGLERFMDAGGWKSRKSETEQDAIVELTLETFGSAL
jgi:hypothetical protein